MENDPAHWPISDFDIVIFEDRDAAVGALRHVLEQVIRGRGFDESTPITEVGTEGFWLFMRTLDLELVQQSASFLDDGILDCMVLAPSEAPEPELTMYNLVPRRMEWAPTGAPPPRECS